MKHLLKSLSVASIFLASLPASPYLSAQWVENGNVVHLSTASARVGVGTSNPFAKLQVESYSDGANGQPQILLTQTNPAEWARIRFDAGGNLWTLSAGGSGSSTPNAFNIYSHSANANYLTIKSTGEVGLGLNTAFETPLNRLDVKGGMVIGSMFAANQKAPNSGLLVEGGIGVSTTVIGSHRLVVSGSAWVTSGIWSGSDMQWKQGITTIDGALDKVLNIRGVGYQWRRGDYPDKNFPAGTEYGFIAQDLESVAPELVRTGADGFKGVSYQGMTALLTEAVKDQQTIIDMQRVRIEALEEKVRMIEEKIGSAGRDDDDDHAISGAFLGQNDPNPSADITSISYALPRGAEKGELVITETGSGREVRRYDLLRNGNGEINIPVKDLANGTYIYSMVVEGRVVGSGKMGVGF